FFPDAELERTVIMTRVEGERFRTAGTVVLEPGWREVDPVGKDATRKGSSQGGAGEEPGESEAELPLVTEGEGARAAKAEVLAKQTKAPPRHSEASLLGAMETAGKQIDDE